MKICLIKYIFLKGKICIYIFNTKTGTRSCCVGYKSAVRDPFSSILPLIHYIVQKYS